MHSGSGWIGPLHTVLGFLCLVLGTAVVAARKGTRQHRRLGLGYAAAMLGLNDTALEPPWVRRLREVDPGVRIGVDGKLYAGRARWVHDPAVLEPLLPAVLRKYHLVETARAHFVPAPERHPGTQIQHVFFRVDPP